MDALWYYAINGERFGPVSAKELSELASNGTLNRKDLIWKEGLPEWVHAGRAKGLFPAIYEMPPPLPLTSPPPLPAAAFETLAAADKISPLNVTSSNKSKIGLGEPINRQISELIEEPPHRVVKRELEEHYEAIAPTKKPFTISWPAKIAVGFVLAVIAFGIKLSHESEKKDLSQTNSQSDKSDSPVFDTSTVNGDPGKLDWDKKNIDIQNNNNMNLAVKVLRSGIFTVRPIKADTSEVLKAPWKYYGQYLGFKGVIADLGDKPAGSDVSEKLGGGVTSEIVVAGEDDAAIYLFGIGGTGTLKKNDEVTVYGLPIGTMAVGNSLGGQTNDLIIVGKTLDITHNNPDNFQSSVNPANSALQTNLRPVDVIGYYESKDKYFSTEIVEDKDSSEVVAVEINSLCGSIDNPHIGSFKGRGLIGSENMLHLKNDAEYEKECTVDVKFDKKSDGSKTIKSLETFESEGCMFDTGDCGLSKKMFRAIKKN